MTAARTLSDAELEALLERAAERGATKALERRRGKSAERVAPEVIEARVDEAMRRGVRSRKRRAA